MFIKGMLRTIFGIGSIFLLSACGGDSPGGGVGVFTTVSVSPIASTTRLESDVLKGNTCTSGVSTVGTFVTDYVDVTFNSTIFKSPGLPVAIDSYTVEFSPNLALSTAPPPALPSLPSTSIGQTISAGGSSKLSIAVVPESLKIKLTNGTDIVPSLPLCSPTVYAYYATVTFSARELGGTGPGKNLIISLDVVFADRT